MCFSAVLSTTYIRASTLNMTLPIICAGIISQEVGYFENSTLSASLRKQPFIFLVAIQIPGLENDNSNSNS